MKKASSKVVEKKSWRMTVRLLALCVWVFVSVVTAQIVIGRLMLWILGAETLMQPVWMAVYSALVYVVAMALVIGAPIALKKKLQPSKQARAHSKLQSFSMRELRQDLGLGGLPTWTDVGLAPIGFVVAIISAAGLVALFSIFPWFDAAQAQDVGFSTYLTGGDRIIAFITLVVIAPIAEEIIFRGWLYGKLRDTMNGKLPEYAGKIISIVLVSALFGLVHFQWNVGVNVFCLSVVLCVLREITGTIYAGILAHMIKNGVAFYLLYVLGIG